MCARVERKKILSMLYMPTREREREREGQAETSLGPRKAKEDRKSNAFFLSGKGSEHRMCGREVCIWCCSATGETGFTSLRSVELQHVNTSMEGVGSWMF